MHHTLQFNKKKSNVEDFQLFQTPHKINLKIQVILYEK